MNTFPLTPDQAAWMARMMPPPPAKSAHKNAAKPDPTPLLTDQEIAWLWPRFQKCSVQTYSFARSFQKTAADKLTPKGKAIVHSVAYTYRRQIFADSGKWSEAQFVQAIKTAASA